MFAPRCSGYSIRSTVCSIPNIHPTAFSPQLSAHDVPQCAECTMCVTAHGAHHSRMKNIRQELCRVCWMLLTIRPTMWIPLLECVIHNGYSTTCQPYHMRVIHRNTDCIQWYTLSCTLYRVPFYPAETHSRPNHHQPNNTAHCKRHRALCGSRGA